MVSLRNPSFPTPLNGVVVCNGPVSTADLSPPKTEPETLHSVLASLWAEQEQLLTSLGEVGLSHVENSQNCQQECAVEVAHLKPSR